ncbi:MAG: TatD family hydrolase [Candidatus Aenigmatarchaeota archaeon]|nr:MAG: TatD family hydrolase [Candidatus Aenigmarchaeota archaeon]
MIDTHAHLCFPDYGEDPEKIAKECEHEMTAVIVTSARYDEGLLAFKLCAKHPHLFPSMGYHPAEGDGHPEKVMEMIRKEKGSIVGIGEVGLDYHWVRDPQKREQQKKVFSDFIKLAEELNKPLVVHSWDAEPECFGMVKTLQMPVIFHCYSGSRELAEEILKQGFYISISTHVLLSKQLRKIAKMVPLEQMTLETDAPFLSPSKYLETKGMADRLKPGFDPNKNYPWNIRFSAEKIAELKKVSVQEVLQKTTENAVKIFGLRL